ncbi:lactate racemase domain-containing protein [Breznakiella homolactica]|uniref:DUF2088 domain-containing protein n=1 Tax=Breznakiella homolactica TaxID=2798577 RepID=A0A7T7XNS4_9SPIR|nr:lactate racemase domain-containing protein [Breznakiella homolactica]QQO09765.1 nickel-dependent lactate racemase [Breznakiella homolactica]
MTYLAKEGLHLDLSDREIDELFSEALGLALRDTGDPRPVLLLPPDGTRYHSRAGFLCDIAARELLGQSSGRLGAVLPALGTHAAMGKEELIRMFPGTPPELFRNHDWRRDVAELGRLEASWVEAVSGGASAFDWPVQVNRLLRDGGFSLAVSIGQVVPHEVVGMANHLKNIFIGTGGKESIDKSHFMGACYGLERLMGRTDTPVRALLDEGHRRFGKYLPPILFALTVLGPRSDREAEAAGAPRASLAVRGLYVGFGRDCFEKAAALSRRLNVKLLKKPLRKAVVYLDPREYRSTWLGNKSIYRTRMALADGAELIILAPGLVAFGEDPGIDRLIRRHGYRPTGEIKDRIGSDSELADSLSAAAHLIHGSAEGRFTVRYCPGPGLSKAEIESVGYQWGDLQEYCDRYNPNTLNLGWNTVSGERVFFISNPALGLWADEERFNDGSAGGCN